MSAPAGRFTQAESTELDILLCELEPIHIPDAIQPHGALIAVSADSGVVTHASTNLVTMLGRQAHAVLGRPVDELFGDSARRELLRAGATDGMTVGEADFSSGAAGEVHWQAHRTGPYICVDIERVPGGRSGPSPLALTRSLLQAFDHAANRTELLELAVHGLKSISGFDRVMAYRFVGDGQGEVVAEAREARVAAFLGQRYPAADMPAQARRLYMRQRVGTVADSAYLPVPLLSAAAPTDGAPLDLTFSALRSVSPIHREYMRNMRTAASLTIGLARGPELWGMLVCHHGVARIVGPELRSAAKLLGQAVSRLLDSLADAEIVARRRERNAMLRRLTGRLAQSRDLPLLEALRPAGTDLIRVVAAAGVMLQIGGEVLLLGRTPAPPAAGRALAHLRTEAGGEAFAVDDLGQRLPELADCTHDGSGALLLPLAADPDEAILWFRPELPETIIWAGNPAEHGASDPLTGRFCPRPSFDAWEQTLSGHSAPWAPDDLTFARELRGAIATEVAQRALARS